MLTAVNGDNIVPDVPVGKGITNDVFQNPIRRPLLGQPKHAELEGKPYLLYLIWFRLFWYQYRALFIIYSLTNNCTIISNTIITNNMLLHVSTFKMSSSGSLLCLAKITYRFSGLRPENLLLSGLRPDNLYVILARHSELPEDDILNVETCRSMLFVIIVLDIIVQLLVKL